MAGRMTRRAWLAGAGALALPAAGGAAEPLLHVDAARLQASLEALSLRGRRSGGTFADGVSRFAYSDADLAGRAFAMDLMRQAGLEPRIDAAGNIRARRPGSDPGLKALMIGSHIDSVPSGGNFDGALGSMAAIEVARTLAERGRRLRHPLEVALWSNEEGGTIGSEAAAGMLPPSALDQVLNGVRRRDGIVRIGGDPDRLESARIPKGSLAAYLELHIEQSGRLEADRRSVGLVEGIVAIDEWEADIEGAANHAGTTPMPDRRNALLAAARLIEAVQEEVTREPGRQVGTVGQIEVAPNVRNIVPGRVRCSIEIRDLDDAKVARIGEAIVRRAARIAEETGVRIALTRVERDPAAITSPQIRRPIAAAAAALGLTVEPLPSFAGHDAGPISTLAPMGMIFVPSVGGISHSPRELTRWSDCANGADVLLGTLLRLDAID